MTGLQVSDPIPMDPMALGRMMPLHLVLDPEGRIISAGPTLAKLFDRPGDLSGGKFFNLFEIRRPSGIDSMSGLIEQAGSRLKLHARHAMAMPLRGIAQPLPGKGGAIINLSFGIGVIEAVAAYDLTDADFAATDLAMELLYLTEANAVVTHELKQLNLRLQGARDAAEEQALTDTLTGLRNRRALELALDRAISEGTQFALMHVDLDYFKAVNDTLGHAAGDYVLQEVAGKLLAETRKDDTVARVGGDEFVIVFHNLSDRAQLSGIAERLVARLGEPLEFDGKPCRVSASIGITVSSSYAKPEAERMLDDADQALYASKKAGRGRALHFLSTNPGRSDPAVV
ncbi:MAG: diguanylate cyclase domain-containing protein [Pseudorhodobacter sp.]